MGTESMIFLLLFSNTSVTMKCKHNLWYFLLLFSNTSITIKWNRIYDILITIFKYICDNEM